MIKQTTCTAFFLFCCALLHAQSTGPVTVRPPANGNATFRPQTFDSQVFLIDPNGKPLNRDYTDMNGSPFLFNDFKLAKLVLFGGKTFDSVRVRLEIEHHDLHYLNQSSAFVLSKGRLAEIDFIEPIPTPSAKFKCGYPAIDNQDQYSFYNVLAEGKIDLLKVSRKKFVSNKNEMSGEIDNRYQLYEDYYIAIAGEIKRLRKDRDFLLVLFADQKEKIGTYLKETKPNLKTDSELIALFGYYNSL